MTDEVIEFLDVKKTYVMGGNNQYEALRGVSFKIASKELVAIMGPSGSGKSTTMHILGLLDRPTSGKYLLKGRNVVDLNLSEKAVLRNESIGFVFQQFYLLPKLSALENVGLPLMYRGVHHKEIHERSMAMLERVKMDKHASHRPTELSGGQQQRVAIARALVGEPAIILADEPTGALDTKTSHEVMQMLTETARQSTVIIITHDPEVGAQCQRLLHIRDGLIEEEVR